MRTRLTLSFFLFMFCSHYVSAQEVIDRLVAAIDGEPITLSDLNKFAAEQQGLTKAVPLTDRATQNKYLEDLIAQRLLDKEAQSLNLAVTDADVDAYITEVKKQNSFTDKELTQLLEQKGIPATNYRQEIKKEILKSRIVSTVLRKSINITEADIDNYLAEHTELQAQAGTLNVGQGTFSDEEDAKEIKAQCVDGKKLSSLAPAGYRDLGYVRPEDLREEFQAALEGLSENEVSEVINLDGKYTLLQVLDLSDDGIIQDKDLRDKIRNQLFEKQTKERLGKYIAEELPKKYIIEHF
ncbi:MAG: SurA N-terminal domain-containing protein [Deltaproteobacteria bacterium]|nr:SurA N-terminal domain-containing protein [Deltaproteobacteria bacterium]